MPTISNSFISFNGWNTNKDNTASAYSSSDLSMSINPFRSSSSLFTLYEFGFGKTDTVANTEYYESLLNDYGKMNIENPLENPDALFSNTTGFSLNVRGIGLPSD